MYMYVAIQQNACMYLQTPPHEQDVTQGQF